MIFTPLAIPGAYRIEPERREDSRGFFARTWCAEEFRQRGLNPNLVQCNVSFNRRAGTLRGMHYQAAPHAEAKLIRCTMGAAYDVLVDLRPEQPTYRQWVAVELSAESRRMVYIPEGCAHGFQTLCDDTELFYQMSAPYVPEAARGVRWNDPMLGITWPLPVGEIAPRDAQFEELRP